jgi:hypothetical protein
MSNVVSMSSRRPLEVEQAEQELMDAAEEEVRLTALSENQLEMIATLEATMQLVTSGRLEGFVLLGRDPSTGIFLTEVHLAPVSVSKVDMFAYVGCMDVLKMELAEIAAMAPLMTKDGEIIDPFENVDEMPEWEYEE